MRMKVHSWELEKGVCCKFADAAPLEIVIDTGVHDDVGDLHNTSHSHFDSLEEVDVVGL